MRLSLEIANSRGGSGKRIIVEAVRKGSSMSNHDIKLTSLSKTSG